MATLRHPCVRYRTNVVLSATGMMKALTTMMDSGNDVIFLYKVGFPVRLLKDVDPDNPLDVRHWLEFRLIMHLIGEEKEIGISGTLQRKPCGNPKVDQFEFLVKTNAKVTAQTGSVSTATSFRIPQLTIGDKYFTFILDPDDVTNDMELDFLVECFNP